MWIKWVVMSLVLVGVLALDLGLFHKKGKELTFFQNTLISIFYFLISLAFGGYIYLTQGTVSAHEYVTGFLIEKTLAMDNIFVIALIFKTFSVPKSYQSRVLFWGILGAIVLRGICIALGAALIEQFSWVLYLFSVFLLLTGLKILFLPEKPIDFTKNPLVRWMNYVVEVTPILHKQNFFIKHPNPDQSKAWIKSYLATPLFLALLLVEFTDLVFALDSVPAIFSITNDVYIVYTSNIFAILGLRSLYFVLQHMVDRFRYLKTALGILLLFIGSKIFIKDILGVEKLDSQMVLMITVGILLAGIFASILIPVRTSSPTSKKRK